MHPERLYENLVAVAGELATMIRTERKPPPLPRYDHENPQLCFDPVFDLLQSMLSAVFDRSAIQLPLEPAGPGAWLSRISDHNLFKNGYFYLAVSAAVSLDDIRERFPNRRQDRLGHQDAADRRVGVARRPAAAHADAAAQLRVLPGFVYFELDRSVPTGATSLARRRWGCTSRVTGHSLRWNCGA